MTEYFFLTNGWIARNSIHRHGLAGRVGHLIAHVYATFGLHICMSLNQSVELYGRVVWYSLFRIRSAAKVTDRRHKSVDLEIQSHGQPLALAVGWLVILIDKGCLAHRHASDI